jgi:hypothetical protein
MRSVGSPSRRGLRVQMLEEQPRLAARLLFEPLGAPAEEQTEEWGKQSSSRNYTGTCTSIHLSVDELGRFTNTDFLIRLFPLIQPSQVLTEPSC